MIWLYWVRKEKKKITIQYSQLATAVLNHYYELIVERVPITQVRSMLCGGEFEVEMEMENINIEK